MSGGPTCWSARRSAPGTMEAGAADAVPQPAALQGASPTSCRSGPATAPARACGKGISAIPQSTLGYERRFNWAFARRRRGRVRPPGARRPAGAAAVLRHDEAHQPARPARSRRSADGAAAPTGAAAGAARGRRVRHRRAARRRVRRAPRARHAQHSRSTAPSRPGPAGSHPTITTCTSSSGTRRGGRWRKRCSTSR